MFYGSQSHAFSCRHEMHDLLTLVSYINTTNEFLFHLSQHMSKNKKTVGGVPHIQGTPPTVQDDPFTTNTFSHHNTVNYHQIR